MGPLNEFERRFLDVTQQRLFLIGANMGGQPPEPFGYNLAIGSAAAPLTSGVTRQGIITIQADSWFLWNYLSVGVTIPTLANRGGPEQVSEASNLLLQISQSGTGEDMYSLPAGLSGMPAALLAGTPVSNAAGIPGIFATPVLLPPNTSLIFSLTKLGTNAGGDNPDMTGAYIMLNGSRIVVAG